MATPLVAAVRNPDVRRLIGATSCSALASGIFLGALPLAVAERGGGPLQVGMVSAALTIWWIVSMPLSALVDRWGVGLTLRVAAPLRIVALLVIAAHAVVRGEASIAVMGAGALAYGLVDVVTDTAASALPALVVDEDRYDEAYSLFYTVNRVADLVLGPSAGALLLVTERWLPFVLAGLLLAVSYAAYARFFTDPRAARVSSTGEAGGWFTRITAGVRHVWDDPFLRAVVLTLTGIVIAEEIVAVVVTPYFRDGSGRSDWAQMLGFIRSGTGIAAVVAALCSGALARRFTRTRTLSVVALGGALCPAVLAIAPHWLPVLGALTIAAVAESLWVPLVQSEVARRTPPHLMARTRAAMMFITWGTLPFTSLVGGGIAQAVGVRPVLMAAAIAALASCALGIWRYAGWRSNARRAVRAEH
ncbi:MAG: MFS transporter [Mycobacteriales bacterium]|nr:MAG: hypothetical protein DLM56_14115 [Pseudonocardiales bacterium]